MTPEIQTALREKLADLCHEQWTGWMRYLFSRGTIDATGWHIPAALVERWQRQMDTPYARLSARDQDSDRKEADHYLALLSPEPAAGQAQELGEPLCATCEGTGTYWEPHDEVNVDEELTCQDCGGTGHASGLGAPAPQPVPAQDGPEPSVEPSK